VRTVPTTETDLATARHRACHARVYISDEGGNLFLANVQTGTDTSSNTDGLAAQTTGTVSSSTTKAWTGDRSLKVESGGSAGGMYTAATAVTASTQYFASVYLRSDTEYKTVSVYLRDAVNATNGTALTVRLRPDRWIRVGVTHTMGAGSPTAELYVVDADGTDWDWYCDGFQLEQRDHATRWTTRDTEWEVELTDHVGVNWVRSVEWAESSKDASATATIRLRREAGDGILTLMPGKQSRANVNGASTDNVLVVGRLVWIDVQIGPHGAGADAAGTWTEYFRGRIDKIDLSGQDTSEIVLTCRDRFGQEVMDAFVFDEQPPQAFDSDGTAIEDWYTDLTWGLAAETFAQDFLDGTIGPGVAPTLVVDGTVGWTLNEPTPDTPLVRTGPLLDAVRQIAAQLGHDVRGRWNAAASDWRLTWTVPDRATVTADFTWPLGFYRVEGYSFSLDDVRNSIDVVFRDSANSNKLTRVESRDSSSIQLYGERMAMAIEAANSNIDTTSEAQELADILRKELQQPYGDATIKGGLYPYVELEDIGSFTGPNRYTDDALRMRVVGARHSISDGAATTTLTLRGVDTTAGVAPAWTPLTAVIRTASTTPNAVPSPSSYRSGARSHAQSIVTDTEGSKVRAYLSGDQTVNAGAAATVGYDALSYDAALAFGTGTSIWTCPVTGQYAIGATVTISGTSGDAGRLYLTVGGTTVEIGSAHVALDASSSEKAFSVWVPLNLTAGDTIRANLKNNGAATMTVKLGTAKSFFTVERMR